MVANLSKVGTVYHGEVHNNMYIFIKKKNIWFLKAMDYKLLKAFPKHAMLQAQPNIPVIVLQYASILTS